MEKAKLTTVGSVVAAIIASLCCIGPVVVALIGVGSIGAFAVFEAYRPYLIALTAILLGLAFYLTYRKREVVCEDGTCTIQSASRWNKLTVWLAAVLATGAVAFPAFNLTDSHAAETLLARQGRTSSGYAVAVLSIDGMDCKGCAKGLEATLGRADGVRKAAVEFEKSQAVVEYDSTRITLRRLIAVVDETGFKATVATHSSHDN